MKAWAYVVLAVIALGVLGTGAKMAVDYGDSQCVARYAAAEQKPQGKAQKIVVEHDEADRARIAQLEADNQALQDQLNTREQTRNTIPLSEACNQCRIPRAWMRGETKPAGPTK